MASDSEEPLDFPQSDTIRELSSDDSFDELMLKPVKMNTLAQASFISMNPPEMIPDPQMEPRAVSESISSSVRVILTPREKADIKNRKAREKRAREKVHADDADDEEGEAPVKKKKRASKEKQKKKSKCKTDVFEVSSDDEESEPVKKFTVYIDIEGPKPTAAMSRSKAPATSALTIKRGPFIHATDESFFSSQQRIAAETPCNVKLLVLSQLYWKFEKPLGAPRKLVRNKVGYEAMVSSVSEKKGDCVVLVFMPPPEKDIAWDTGDPDQVGDPFDYDQEVAANHPEGLSRKDQMDALSKKSNSRYEELCARYPINNVPEYPEKRVYKDGERCWELTELRLKVWAANMVNGGATIDKPPTSVHFNDDKKLRAPIHAVPRLDAGPNVNFMLPPGPPPNWQQYTWQQYQQYPPQQYAPPPYMYQHHPPHPHMPHPNHQQPYLTEPSSTLSSPGTALARKVPLIDFCNRYNISDSNRQKLMELEYKPGNKMVESLDEQEWRHGVKFTALGWNGFLAAHKKFCRDVKSGIWE